MVALRAPRSATVGALLLAGLLARAQEDDGLVVYGWDSDALEEQDEWGLPAFRERHIKVHHLSPSFGRNAGGLLVNVTGKGFVVATDPKCQFGGEDSMIVNATVRSANLMQCWSPINDEKDGGIPWSRSYDVYSRAVEVSLNGVDWTTSNRAFTYYDHNKLFVSLLEPQGGPVAGGTVITVHGSMFQQSDHLKCKFKRVPNENCGEGSAAHNSTCDMAPVTTVDATFLTYWSLKCISPPDFPESIGGAGGLPALPVDALNDVWAHPSVTRIEVALDDYHFTDHKREWHYYDTAKLAISAIDPIGGPTAGGTMIEVLGSGFAELGGSSQHGSTIFANETYDAHRRIDHGTFCKFSLNADSPMLVDFACIDDQCTEGNVAYNGVLSGSIQPREGEMAVLDAASESHLRNFSTFTQSSTPSLGQWSSVVRATFVNPNLLRCESPAYHGTLTDHRVILDVRVVLNSDFHDLNALSLSNATFTLYDRYEARISSMDRTGGPIDGNTSVIITGKLFGDYTSRALQYMSEPLDPLGGNPGDDHPKGGDGTNPVMFSGEPYLKPYGYVRSGPAGADDGASRPTMPPRDHLLRCRFGWVGETLATFVDERTVKCSSPRLNISSRDDVLGSGHDDDVPVDLTFNGQDYLRGRDLRFIYSQRDEYKWNSSCLNQWGQVTEGMCQNTHTGIAVFWLQPMGGPADGGTRVVVMGQHFAVRGPSIQCAFGDLPRVNATFVNDSAVVCVSPPAPGVAGSFTDFHLDVTLNAETNFLTSSRIPFVYYNHTATLSVTSIYPQAGDKRGGNIITVTGTGFRVLGGINEKRCMQQSELVNATEQLDGPRMCRAEPEDESTNRGLQCIFGNMPPVKAYQVLVPANAQAPENTQATSFSHENMRTPHQVVTQITCEAPPLPVAELTAAGLTPDDIFPVCVEVTLNGNQSQATSNCVEFTYYDF